MPTSSSPKPPASAYHHGDLREALLSAGYDEINEHGVETLSLRAVARRVGVSAMAPYRHYADKTALLAAISERGFAELRVCLSEADHGLAGAAALQAQGRAYIDFATARPGLFRLMFSAYQPDPSREPAPMDDDAWIANTTDDNAFGVLRARVATVVAPDQVQATAIGLWGLVHGLAMLVLDRCLISVDIDAVLAATLRIGEA